MMKVVETDNFGRDYPDEKFACPYALRDDYAQELAEFFNERLGGLTAPRYWKVVPIDYKLQPGFEP